MDSFRISVKSFILDTQNRLLMVKRRINDPHCAGSWEVPGGRLEIGEDPFLGLKRETKEEVGLEIDILDPLKVKHFTREDGQKITMMTFLCRSKSEKIALSREHTEYAWLSLDEALEKIHPAYKEDIKAIQKDSSVKKP